MAVFRACDLPDADDYHENLWFLAAAIWTGSAALIPNAQVLDRILSEFIRFGPASVKFTDGPLPFRLSMLSSVRSTDGEVVKMSFGVLIKNYEESRGDVPPWERDVMKGFTLSAFTKSVDIDRRGLVQIINEAREIIARVKDGKLPQ